MAYKYQFIGSLKDPEVFRYLRGYNLDLIQREESINLFRKCVDTYKKWLSEGGDIKIVGLDCFPYVYFTNGVCGAVESVVFSSGYENFFASLNDFPYYKFAVKSGRRKWKNPDCETHDPVLMFVSNPQYSTGVFKEKLLGSFNDKKNVNVFYDMSYITCCLWKGEIDLSSACEFCAFSLSKAFGLEHYRLGILFSKRKLPSLEVWHRSGYLNVNSLSLSIYMMKQFSMNYLPRKYGEKYKRICKERGLTETHSPWLALSAEGQRVGVSHLYNKTNTG